LGLFLLSSLSGITGLRLLASSPRDIVLASTFYTAALEQYLRNALSEAGAASSISCVPYNQLHTFLLRPRSLVSEGIATKIILLFRAEDLVRTELVASAVPAQCLQAFRERSKEFLEVLCGISGVQLTVLICPSGRGAFDVSFLGNALRVTEHRVTAELRRQQVHRVIPWSEFERSWKVGKLFNPAGDRLGHVPFSPEGLEVIARFLVAELGRMPDTKLDTSGGGGGKEHLERFLNSLELKMSIAPLNDEDEALAVNLVRHTTHFVNWPGRKWDRGDIATLAARQKRGQAWSIRVRDRFGDYGLSGALTFGIEDGTMRVGLLFLTCPVLGRQVEYGLWGWIAKVGEELGVDLINVPFTPGRDNQGLRHLLTRLADGNGHCHAVAHSLSDMSFTLRVHGLTDRILQEAPSPMSARIIVAKLQAESVQLSM
jgi:hypothetical protein